MSRLSLLCAVALIAVPLENADANLLFNGNLDQTYAQEIVPGFFLPKPLNWVNEGTRSISGPYEDELSSEPWAGPAPTPVTMDASGLASPNGVGVGQLDGAVFFKAFTGNTTHGAATGHLYQNVPGIAGVRYTLTGWAGAEANFLADDALFALDFFDPGATLIGSATLSLKPSLFVDNGQPFDYKQYSLNAVAPAGTTTVRARVSMINGTSNPQGGGQAFVVDDFTLTADTVVAILPEPATFGLLALASTALLTTRRRTA